MAEIQWPASLQQKLDADTFQETLANTLIRSENDLGPAKVRRRHTKGVKEWSVSIRVTIAQYSTLTTFYNNTIAGGSLRFEFLHPITQIAVLARIVDPPTIQPLNGGIIFKVNMKWEILPSG